MAIEPFLQVIWLNSVAFQRLLKPWYVYVLSFLFSFFRRLQAEVDRKYSRELQEQLEREAEIMKNVPGWEVGKPAYVKRWRRPLLDRSAGDWLGPEAPIYKPEK